MTSKIEWTDETWNPVAGCAKVSAGCRNCYAERMAARLRAMALASHDATSPYLQIIDERGRWTGKFVEVLERLMDPLGWKQPRKVFVNSMSDLFGEGVSFEYIAAVFGVMAATPMHTYQVLTKRPARMLEFFRHTFGLEDTPTTVAREAEERHKVIWDARGSDPAAYGRVAGPSADAIHIKRRRAWEWPLPNVWVGVSVENQAAADERIPLLLQTPAAVRFLSCEPLLDWVNLRRLGNGGDALWPRAGGIDWVIAGGESGPGARLMDPIWVRSLRDQCASAGVFFFFKQWGGPNKKKAGRVLDGRTHDAMPEVRP